MMPSGEALADDVVPLQLRILLMSPETGHALLNEEERVLLVRREPPPHYARARRQLPGVPPGNRGVHSRDIMCAQRGVHSRDKRFAQMGVHSVTTMATTTAITMATIHRDHRGPRPPRPPTAAIRRGPDAAREAGRAGEVVDAAGCADTARAACKLRGPSACCRIRSAARSETTVEGAKGAACGWEHAKGTPFSGGYRYPTVHPSRPSGRHSLDLL